MLEHLYFSIYFLFYFFLSDGKKKCPIDNEDLTVGKMFPDNFAKREILSMKVRCPNRKMGCNTCVELKHVEVC